MSTDVVLAVDQSRAEGFIGASEVPAALGLVKYRSPMAVWRQLRDGVVEPVPDAVREAAEFGVLFEPVIRGQYAMTERKRVLVPRESLTFGGWLRATPDGIVVDAFDHQDIGTEEWQGGTFPHGAGLLQVKCRSAYQADAWADGPPPAEEVQCRVEMAVTGAPWNDLVCVLGGNRRVKYRIERDLKIEENILRDARAFWDLVQSGTPPTVDHSEAWQSYASSKMQHTKVAIVADADCRAFMVELRQARTERKRAERQEAELKSQLLLRLGAAGATVMTDAELGKLSAFPNPAKMQWKEYAEHLERLVNDTTTWRGTDAVMRDRWKKPGDGWQLRVPREWSTEDDE